MPRRQQHSAAYLAAAATDCFLFAQAIGHVRPGPQGDGDTLAAHRLARARSETVNAALIAAGLPADAVTSVWDRQFAAREPRVTLWVFARPAGDDCTGASLPGAVTQVAVIPARPTGHARNRNGECAGATSSPRPAFTWSSGPRRPMAKVASCRCAWPSLPRPSPRSDR